MRLKAWLIVSALGLAAVLIVSTYSYVHVMYDDVFTRESLVEASSFAVQTVTTVGYGNWEHPARGDRLNQGQRILTLRAMSVGFMLLGATFYVLVTGVVVASLVPDRD